MDKMNRCLKAKDKILNILEKEEITLDEFNNRICGESSIKTKRYSRKNNKYG